MTGGTTGRLSRRQLAILAGGVASAALTGCGRQGGDVLASPTATPDIVSGGARFGVAGLVPPHWPNPSDDDWRTLYASFKETGSLVGVYTAWADSPTVEGGAPAVFASATPAIRAQGLDVVAGISMHRDGPGGTPVLALNPADPDQGARFIRAATAIAAQKPPYLFLLNEFDRVARVFPEQVDALIALYRETRTAVRQAAPGTKVFATFQFELLRGGGYLTDGSRKREPSWDLLARFDGELDVVGVTTYPFFDFETPADIPEGYYRELAERTGAPLAFTEVGWPSAPLSATPGSGHGGTLDEQAAFVDRFRGLTEGLPVEFALWAFPFDVGTATGPAFESIALRTNDGAPKPALDRWRLP